MILPSSHACPKAGDFSTSYLYKQPGLEHLYLVVAGVSHWAVFPPAS